ncbi:hypothetical protein AO385_1954 [Moraxella catarrhalis]|uniref:Uncharacterized protein n=1 Tax=Moraxella catarrhalis TaxID=480 RepID=A0A198UDP5_MORCA|nr:hypothetical protein AO384_1893 [Moraxella catarrhalis]OAU95530.1 hypothetical protein AO385_1954 [Moraxella catarrhalis]OAU96860.1 hypothetical protein AO383_1377 [Moraxella catarrhalis]OAV02121.1 hypothetical protein AO382_0487 [Moraxella catarrhalis]
MINCKKWGNVLEETHCLDNMPSMIPKSWQSHNMQIKIFLVD